MSPLRNTVAVIWPSLSSPEYTASRNWTFGTDGERWKRNVAHAMTKCLKIVGGLSLKISFNIQAAGATVCKKRTGVKL